MLIAPFPKNEGNLLGISGIAGIINNGDQSTFAITNPRSNSVEHWFRNSRCGLPLGEFVCNFLPDSNRNPDNSRNG